MDLQPASFVTIFEEWRNNIHKYLNVKVMDSFDLTQVK
jgi:hypothetical protein